jgi:SAM-dependent methyltransferase
VPAPRDASAEFIRDVNIRYHDAAAGTYDSKWGIDFGPVGQAQVRAKFAKALGGLPAPSFGDALEIGSGTGYFSLNLMQLGLVERLTATDISAGMLAALEETAERLGLEIGTLVTDAEELPFDDGSFDLVFGHAVLHHIPDLRRAFSEFRRVLRPGGAILFCGEPSRYGDRLAALPKRAGMVAAPLWRTLLGIAPRSAADSNGDRPERELERFVDVHAFSPAELRGRLEQAGFDERRVRGEELLASLWGWGLRSVESTAEPDDVPRRWRQFAFRSYLALQRLDSALLEPRAPAELFYNLLVSARKPT